MPIWRHRTSWNRSDAVRTIRKHRSIRGAPICGANRCRRSTSISPRRSISCGWSFAIAIWPFPLSMCNCCSVCGKPAMPWPSSRTGHRMRSERRSPSCVCVTISIVCSSRQICRGRSHIRRYSMQRAISSTLNRTNVPWLATNWRRTSRWVRAQCGWGIGLSVKLGLSFKAEQLSENHL